MIRSMLFLFVGLTLVAATMTYSNAGMQEVNYEEPAPLASVRSGSRSSSSSSGYRSSGYSSGYSSGGYRGGK
ncbi:MAG: hypothetical protein KAH03_05925 [Cocleimonas sp.]|nr:hypothetical protein [Cocleimonas sp.]